VKPLIRSRRSRRPWHAVLIYRFPHALTPHLAIPQPAFPSITAWEKDGLRVAFDFSKPPGQPAVTDITATYTTASGEVSDFTLQVR